MSKVKWIKITTDMFDHSKIKQLRRLPEGNNIVLIWVMLLTMAGKCNSGGMIILSENVPYTDEMLADELRFDVNTVRIVLDYLAKFGMIHQDEDCFIISNWKEYQSAEKLESIREYERERKARNRLKQKEKQLNKIEKKDVPDMSTDMSTDSSISISISKSYIFNNNKKNIDNYIYIKELEEYIYIKNNRELDEMIGHWMEYKDSRTPKKNNHYEERGMKSLLSMVIRKCNEVGDKAVIEQIETAMAYGWQGMNLDKIQAKKPLTGNEALSDRWRGWKKE